MSRLVSRLTAYVLLVSRDSKTVFWLHHCYRCIPHGSH